MSLTNPNKVVTEERLAEFYGQLLPYLGGMPEAVVNKFSKSDLYSTTEKIVGCWTDGRPIYQKTINCGALPNNTTKDTTIDVANVSQIVGLSGFVYNSSTKAVFDMNSLMSNTTLSNNFVIYASYNSSTSKYRITMSTKTDVSAYSAYVTVQYTKTTDAANSFNFSTETDYSTTEKIVGTWIDGKPLYQKTISTGTLPNATSKTVATNIANIKRVVNMFGYAFLSQRCITLPYPLKGYECNIDIRSITSSGANIMLNSAGNLSDFTESYVTLQYTKTTD